MIRHVLLIRWKPETTEAQIAEAVARTLSLRELPCISDLRCGRNLGWAADNYDFGVTMDFASRAAWDEYQKDPTHQEHAQFVRSIVGSFARIQFERD